MKALTTDLKDAQKKTVDTDTKAVARSLPRVRKSLNILTVTLFTLAILFLFLSPFAFMVFTSLKTQDQISIVGAPIWPAQPAYYDYNGKQVEIFTVPMSTCQGF